MLLLAGCSVFASEQIPVRIVPAERISTVHDEIQLGDNIMFKTKDDVYYNTAEPTHTTIKPITVISSVTPVFGIVDKIEDNGWAHDNAEILLEKFKLKNTKQEVVTINSQVKINGFELLKIKQKRFAQFFNYIGVVFRGKEIDVRYPDETPEFTIWYEGI